MRKTFPALAFMLALLFSAVSGEMFIINLAKANPYLSYKWVSPPKDALPPKISIFSLKNHTIYSENNISLTLTVSIPESNYSLGLTEIRYQRDWKESIARLYHYTGYGLWITDFSYNLTLSEIPEGSHSITFIAEAGGGYAVGLTAYSFGVSSVSVINFTIDTISPEVSLLHLENETYEASDILINFTVNEQVSLITFSLDGQDNATIYGNTTLTGLSNGRHNITVYVWDRAGHVGASETTYFSVSETEPEPFPTTIVAVASGASVAAVGLGLLVYFKKRQKESGNNE